MFPSLIFFTFTHHIKDCNLLIPLFHSHLQYFLNFQFCSFFLKFLLNSRFAYCIIILFLFSKWIRIRIFYDQASIFFKFSISHTIFLYPLFFIYLFILLFIIYASLFYTSPSIIFLLFFLIFWIFCHLFTWPIVVKVLFTRILFSHAQMVSSLWPAVNERFIFSISELI